jgi:hypothetical protein
MPELPEVEVTRQSFALRIAGARIEAVRMGKPLRWPLGCAPQSLCGQQVQGVRRRGKYLLIDLERGLLLLHLGMSGSVRFEAGLPAPGKHDHFDLQTSAGTLRLHDPRRFGAVVFAPSQDSPQAHKLLGRLGVEPLGEDFAPEAFYQALHLRKTAIKPLLLAGEDTTANTIAWAMKLFIDHPDLLARVRAEVDAIEELADHEEGAVGVRADVDDARGGVFRARRRRDGDGRPVPVPIDEQHHGAGVPGELAHRRGEGTAQQLELQR